MRWLDDKIYTNDMLEMIDKEKFPLTYKMSSKNKFDTGSIIVRKLIDQEIDHPIWIAIYEERKPQQFHIYSLEVYKSYQLQDYGRRALTKFKENANLITLCSLPETKVFYEKLGFKEADESGLRLIWRKNFGRKNK
jgi:GNAT superfamily N-acetyltransferase